MFKLRSVWLWWRTFSWVWWCSPQKPVWVCIMSPSFTHLPAILCFSTSSIHPPLLLLTTVGPVIPPFRTTTTSPPGLTSAPCICPMRGGAGAATTASSQRGPCSPTGRRHSTSTSTSPTGRRLQGTLAAALPLRLLGPRPAGGELDWRWKCKKNKCWLRLLVMRGHQTAAGPGRMSSPHQDGAEPQLCADQVMNMDQSSKAWIFFLFFPRTWLH